MQPNIMSTLSGVSPVLLRPEASNHDSTLSCSPAQSQSQHHDSMHARVTSTEIQTCACVSHHPSCDLLMTQHAFHTHALAGPLHPHSLTGSGAANAPCYRTPPGGAVASAAAATGSSRSSVWSPCKACNRHRQRDRQERQRDRERERFSGSCRETGRERDREMK